MRISEGQIHTLAFRDLQLLQQGQTLMSEKPASDGYGMSATVSGAASSRKERLAAEFRNGQTPSSIEDYRTDCG
jgi:hypothetical protein